MSVEFSPGLILIAGAVLVPLFPGAWRSAYLLLLPVLSFAYLAVLPYGEYGQVLVFDYLLTTVRVDKLSFVFGVVFHLAVFLSVLYALHERDNVQHVAGLMYAGSAIGGVFAGDLITLFIYWELTAISSVFLIWARRTERAYRAGLRYVMIQVTSGLLLLAGVVLRVRETGDIAFDFLGLSDLATSLIFVAFGIKCAFPLLHNWLQDAYPEATVAGTVFLSAFTTKLAVYALARGFPGTDMLVWIGATMTAFPIFYAVIENDLRRVLAYSLNNQLGFMVVGIGIGTEMALNGTAAHAFTHIIYKALLFMSMGAVLYRTGTINGSDLGGLYKSMPYTTAFCIVGAASISAFPLFSGFVSKSLIMTAAADESYVLAWWVLLFASAGVFHHSGIKIPFFAFFARDSGIRCREAPGNMLLAMAAAAFLCVALGIYPEPLYRLLPFPVDYAPYTPTHVITQLQLLLFSALAFALLKRTGIYPPELRATNLDSDWVYRRLPLIVWSTVLLPVAHRIDRCQQWLLSRATSAAVTVPEIRGASLLALFVVLLLFSLLVTGFWQLARP
ncbi:MAG: Na(+)/H(+) antiporter subunit D [Deltaproteobacteria bacterium]|nr:Na(+)/H(+) antiporter subunit D [Deltaproteobacteria bacterium]